MEKRLKDVKIGDCRIENSDYDFLNVSFFNTIDFDKRNLRSIGVRTFGDGSYMGGLVYLISNIERDLEWKVELTSDEDAKILRKAYDELTDSCEKLYKEFWDIPKAPLYYINDNEFNIPIKDGDIVMRRNKKYDDELEFLEIRPNSYGNTFEKDIRQKPDFYKWATRNENNRMRITLHGKKILLSRGYCQYQGNNSLMISSAGAKEYELYKVDVDMKELAHRIKEINNKFYDIAKDIYLKEHTFKKISVKRDWEGYDFNN